MKRRPKKNKKLKKVYFYRRLVLGIVIILFLLLLIFGVRYLFTIQTIEIHGTTKIDDEEILKISNIQKGKSYLSIKKSDIEDKLESLNYVKQANLAFKMPRTLKIEIIEEVPVAQVFDRDMYVLLNKDLKVLEQTTSYNKDLPRIIGVPIRESEPGDYLLNKTENHEKLKFFNELFESKLLSELSSIEVMEQGAQLLTKDEIKIIIRSYRKADYKLQQLEEILSEIDSKNENIKTILLDQGEHPIAIREGEDSFLENNEDISNFQIPPKGAEKDNELSVDENDEIIDNNNELDEVEE